MLLAAFEKKNHAVSFKSTDANNKKFTNDKTIDMAVRFAS